MGRAIVAGGKPNMAAPSRYKQTLADNDWASIREASDAGVAASLWAVGDTKSVTINGTVGDKTTYTNLVIDAYIVGFDHNSAKEGEKRIHFKLGKINGVDVAVVDVNDGSGQFFSAGYFTFDYTGEGNSVGWENSTMRKEILSSHQSPNSPVSKSFMACLPSDLRAVMKSVTKYSDNVGGGTTASSNVTATTDYLWLFSEFELRGTHNQANSYEQNYQKQYDYYKAGNSMVHYKHTDPSTQQVVFTRSVEEDNTGRVCIHDPINGNLYGYVYRVYGISPIFAV